MPSQFFGLNIAASGLRAANAWLNTTGNNIANAKTKGYSRQTVTQEANNALRVFATYGCAGAGVDTIAITRIRDSFYDVRYRNNNTRLGEMDSKLYYTNTIQDYFEDDKKTGFKTVFDKMGAALQGLLNDAGSTNAKAQFVSSAKEIADYFNNMYGNMQKLQQDVNAEIKLRTDQINSIAQEIATLNKQINVLEFSGGAANELRDKRDKLLDDLSKIVDVDTEELPIVDSNNQDRETGATRFIVRIAGGQTLVDGNDYNTLVCESRKNYEKVNQSDADGLYNIKWSNGNEFSLTNPNLGGELQGLVEMRDGNNNTGFQGRVNHLGRTPDGRNSTVTIGVTADYLKHPSQCTLSDSGGILDIGGQRYYYSDWSYDEASSSYTFTLNDERCDSIINSNKMGQEATIGASVDYQGIPYYMEQMNEWVRDFATAVNKIFTEGYDASGNRGCYLFTGNKATDPGQYGPGDLEDAANGNFELTAGNFAVWDALLENADLLGTRSDPSEGPKECGQLDKLNTMLKDKTKFSFRNMTAGDFLECILSDMMLNASNAKTLQEMYSDMSNTINNQRSSVSGVDKDEEATNLVRYQQSYTLASKMIQTLTEIYDRLILETGV